MKKELIKNSKFQSRCCAMPFHHTSWPRGSLGLYAVHFRRFRKHFEGKAVDQITIRMLTEMLDALTPRTANQCHALSIDISNHATAKGLSEAIPDLNISEITC